MYRTLIVAILSSWLALVPSGASAFDYAGLGVGADPSTLRSRFPNSRHEFWQRGTGSIAKPEDDDGRFDQWLHEADGLYIIKFSSDDAMGDVTAVSISLEKGHVRRWILSFERIGEGDDPVHVERRYPGCRRILDNLMDRYGKPAKFTTRTEEGMQHRTRSWADDTGEIILDCGTFPNRRPIFAIDIEIVPAG